ncbi:hypothetical protein [Psychroserpens mesophilus]|uniref:hypothetical protein n=1 Tax=Psychroserpens mesophilus TaxID=325473 RepID=UPI00058AC199|nr:hypothetical protein [Psychroserpens mesophilus]
MTKNIIRIEKLTTIQYNGDMDLEVPTTIELSRMDEEMFSHETCLSVVLNHPKGLHHQCIDIKLNPGQVKELIKSLIDIL